jgi:hypothetical protein
LKYVFKANFLEAFRMKHLLTSLVPSVLETLHRDKAGNRKRMKVFWMIFATLLVWEIVPEVGFFLCPGITKF